MATSGLTRRNMIIERDPAAPPKPGRNPPPITRVPSDSYSKRLSTHSEQLDDRVSLFLSLNAALCVYYNYVYLLM